LIGDLLASDFWNLPAANLNTDCESENGESNCCSPNQKRPFFETYFVDCLAVLEEAQQQNPRRCNPDSGRSYAMTESAICRWRRPLSEHPRRYGQLQEASSTEEGNDLLIETFKPQWKIGIPRNSTNPSSAYATYRIAEERP
jgi:hypothetical protein